MFTKTELQNRGFIPNKYTIGDVFPEGFNLPKKITHKEFQKIPLYIKVRYEYYADTKGEHSFVI